LGVGVRVMDAAARGDVWHRAAPALGADDPRDVGSPERGFGFFTKKKRVGPKRRFFGFRCKKRTKLLVPLVRVVDVLVLAPYAYDVRVHAIRCRPRGEPSDRRVHGVVPRRAPPRQGNLPPARVRLAVEHGLVRERARARDDARDERRRDCRGERLHDAGAIRRQDIGCSVVLAMAVMAALYIAGMNGVARVSA